MSEERFDRIESQIAQLSDLMQQSTSATQQQITAINQSLSATHQQITAINQSLSATHQQITAINQNVNALREDVTDLRHRIDSVEGTQNLMIREGFKSLMSYNDDLNYELADNARQTRLLRRRVIRLEGKDKEDK
jgi:predicted  nucleic acid-binding Zn-ribbon protein